jgi:hypothetical protein
VRGTQSTGSWSDSVTAAGIDAPTQTIILTSSVAGVTTIKATPLSATGVPGTAVTKTVTWVAATTKGTYDHSYARISSDITTQSGATVYNNQAGVDSTTAQLTFSSTVTGNKVAAVVTRQFNASDTSTTTTLDVTGTKSVVVAISGAGLIGATAGTAGASATVAAATATDAAFYVFADGRNGKATITVTVNGVLVDTKYVNFFGVVAAYAASTTEGETLSKNYIGTGSTESATVTIKGLDSNKVVMAAGTFYVKPDTSTIATATTSGGVVYIVGVAAGKTNINVCDTSDCVSPKIKYSFPIEVTSTAVESVSLAFDKETYAPGEKMTVKVSALTDKGRPVADGSRVVFAETATANILPNGSLPGTTVAFVDGVGSYTLYAPASAGTLTITATEASGVAATAQAAASASGATYTAAVRTATATISSSGLDAATDAANEATDAANAATDAALQAADDAAAASAAVAKLSKSVNKALKALKAQITALTKLVNRLL